MKKILSILTILVLSFSSLFAASMSPRVRSLPKNLQEQIFIDPKENIIDFTKALTNGIGDTASKVKVIHDWICDNIAYDCNVFTKEGAGEQGYEAVLKKRKAVCVGYANLMAVMCKIVNIEAEIVYGWSKGFLYPGYLQEESDHAWNAIKIGNSWKLIDVTWDAGFVERRTFIKRYTNQWYNLKPSQFIYSHLPEEEKWQLLPEKQIRSHEQFEKEPYISGVFFEYGLSLGKNAPNYKNEIIEATSFDFTSSNPKVSLTGDIKNDSSGVVVKQAVWFENSGNTKKFTFDVPDKENYTVGLGARINGVTNNPPYFFKADFEQNVFPKAQNLLAQKKITKNEFDLFEKAYYFVEQNGKYYFDEDLFNNPRNSANTKILKLLERNTSRYETVLSFELKAAEDYSGFGKDVRRFPQMHGNYVNSSKIQVNSPFTGSLKKGSEQHFSITTNAFSHFAIVLPENEFVFFTKNQKNGSFELDFTIPENVEKITIFASKNKRDFPALFSYDVK
ncbi:transglutaminase domain-containing protein [Treponema sp. UBA3813]|uniref:transglutaminase domain-containing protein n=1 Tax=Treponema sp. UBA3813 TaxID=1947715 RepID=UPI0025E863C0|nr:transglutaminase domain-containing protein [Treponema sp. UBA3813]